MKRALKERFRRIVSPPFPRLEMLAFVYPVGEGEGEGKGRIILPECFIVCWIDGMLLSRSSSVLLDSKGKGEREGESGRACNTFVNSVVN